MSTSIEKLRRWQQQSGAAVFSDKPATNPPAARATDGAARAGQEKQQCRESHSAIPQIPHRGPATSGNAGTGQLRGLLGRRAQSQLRRATECVTQPALTGDELAPGLRRVEHRYAAVEYGDLLPPRWSSEHAVARERFMCFDTETTGLAGGSGTRAFMIGAADWLTGTLRVRQLYISRMAAETAMLIEFASWLSAKTVLVSYNGRSYDAPLLSTRYRLHRLADPLRELSHVDLLHPVRRVYRDNWGNCRLGTIERQVLNIVRDDDLPGAQAPAAWIDYLRHGASTNLLRVLEHNRQDVVSLARLLEHMAALAAADADCVRADSRWLRRRAIDAPVIRSSSTVSD